MKSIDNKICVSHDLFVNLFSTLCDHNLLLKNFKYVICLPTKLVKL